ncbi:MAG: HEPN domain-containing protein [Candidatus Binataceae bacterium]|jgi:hypothetical protein
MTFEAAERLLKAPALFGAAVFHCQQAAEKALKGFLAWHDTPFRKTHDLEESGEACIAIDATLRETIERAIPLTEYAGSSATPVNTKSPRAKRLKRLSWQRATFTRRSPRFYRMKRSPEFQPKKF